MSVTIEEFTAKLGWKTDSTGLKQFQKSMGSLTAGVVKWGGLITGLFTGAMGRLLITTNANTAKQYQFAKSIGTTSDALEQWEAVLRPTGLGADYVGNSMLFLSRQMGKIKLGQGAEQIKKLQTLGLNQKDLGGKSIAEQFKAVVTAAQGLKDPQVAMATLAGLTDRLGGNAARMLSYLNSSNVSLDEMLKHYEQLDFDTEEGQKASVKFMGAWKDINFAVSSAKQEFFSLLGGALTPMLEAMTKWVTANRDLTKSRLKHWALEIANLLKTIFTRGSKIVGTFGKLIDKVGGFNNAIKIAMIAIVAFKVTPILLELAKLNSGNILAGFKTSMASFAKGGAIGLLIAAAALAIEDLWMSLSGGDSLGNRLSWYVVGFIERMQVGFLELVGFSNKAAKNIMLNFENEFMKKMDKGLFTIIGEWGQSLQNGFVNHFRDAYNYIVKILGLIKLIPGFGGGSTPTPAPINPNQVAVDAINARTAAFQANKKNTSKNIVVNNSINISGANASANDLARLFKGELEKTMQRTLLTVDTGGER